MRYADCPICKGHIKIDLNSQSGTTIDLWFKDADDKMNMLLKALHNYWQWCAEGQKPYYTNSQQGEPAQHFYDGYYNHIKYLPTEDAYEFDIQTFDSPEGDQWWKGKFKYRVRDKEKFHTIKIIEEKSHS